MNKYPLSFWFLIFTEALMAAGYAVSFPFLAIYLNTQKNVPMSFIGIYLSCSMLLGAVSNVFGGELSDRIGRKKIMFFSLFFRSLLVLSIAAVIKHDLDVVYLLIIHPLGIFAGSFFNPAARAYVADFVPPGNRLKAYGIMRIGTNAGWAVGPGIGGFVAVSSYAAMFFITGTVYLLCSGMIYFSLREAGEPKAAPGPSGASNLFSLASVRETLKNRDFAFFCVFTFIIASVMSQLVVPLSLYSKKYLLFTEKQIGLLFTINGAMVVFLQYFVSRFFSRYKITVSLAFGSLLYGAGYFFYGFSDLYYLAALAMMVVTFGELAVSPGLQALSANLAPEHRKGRYMGIHSMMQQVGNSFGIFMGSLLMDHLAPYYRQASWTFMLFMGLTGFVGFSVLGRRVGAADNRLPALPPPAKPGTEMA